MGNKSGAEPVPLVIVEGFLGGAASILVWGNFGGHLNSHSCREQKRKTIFASVGPVSSLHDRACELYYTLKGGTVDYGEEHSLQHNHLRFGRRNAQGLYPEWSRERPLHFLGHSMGGPTIIKLQWLLKTGFFGSCGHPEMILSVTAISAPFRGTQLVYILGERTNAAPAVRPLSIGSALAKVVHLVSFISPLLPRAFDLQTDSRGLSYNQSSLSSLLKQLWKSDWAESRDATPFDATFEAADERESSLEGVIHENTFYRSHVASLTHRRDPCRNNQHTPPLSQSINPILYLRSRTMGTFDYSVLRPMPAFLPEPVDLNTHARNTLEADVEQGKRSPVDGDRELGEEYWANDGAVPLFSQWHPFQCSSTTCQHLEADITSDGTTKYSEPISGVWQVHYLCEAHHASLVPFWIGSQRQKSFWKDLGSWLSAIDEQRSL